MAALPAAAREQLQKVRELAGAAAPDATEVISYGIPALRRKKAFLYFAGYENHISIYPRKVSTEEHFGAELVPFYSGKGTLKFKLGEPIPWDLIQRVLAFMAAD